MPPNSFLPGQQTPIKGHSAPLNGSTKHATAPGQPRQRDGDPCQGCRHLYARYLDGGQQRATCAQGVEYGQPGCWQARSARGNS